jgi:hypothetical protein
MKDASNLHLKVQELCDCFASTNPLKEMSDVIRDPDTDEAALKWIALAVLHGINSNAEKISISTAKDGNVKVSAEYRKADLPSPGPAVGKKVIEAMRTMTYSEKDHDKMTLAFGFRNNSMDLKIKLRHEGNDDKITISFP